MMYNSIGLQQNVHTLTLIVVFKESHLLKKKLGQTSTEIISNTKIDSTQQDPNI